MKKLGSKIKSLRLSRGMTQPQIAEVVGATNYTTISKWESGSNAPKGKDLVLLSDFFNVSVDYLLGIDEKKIIPMNEYNYFPASISAGMPNPVDGMTESESITIPDYLMGKHAGNSDIYVTRVNGDSMNKIIPNNSLIAVKPITLDQMKNGDIVVYEYDNEYAVKRYFLHNNKISFRPYSTDQGFTDQVIDIDNGIELQIKGKVVLYIVETD